MSTSFAEGMVLVDGPTMRERAALHEAGHTVLCRRFGRDVQAVEINAKGEPFSGGTGVLDERRHRILCSAEPASDADREYLIEDTIITWAGIVAEVMEFGGHYQLHTSDVARLNQNKTVLGRDFRSKDYIPRTREELQARWDVVLGVRDALLVETKLSGARVKELVPESSES